MTSDESLESFIAAATGSPFRINDTIAIPGGSKWRAARLDNAASGVPARVFAKIGAMEVLPVFEAERDGLALLKRANSQLSALRVPGVVACGAAAGEAVLILEWIDLEPLTAKSGPAMGRALAALHLNSAEKFGLERDNFIGATPQINTQDGDWVVFWQHHRLQYQLHLAAKNRYPSRLIDRGERLAADCGAFLSSYHPRPSLLHGDTWGGNAAADTSGAPVLFDPAAYYGDREADLAMTELFGGYPEDFQSAYRNAWPLDDGYTVRKAFYNLYHILNHANLFAGDYVRRAEHMIESLLAEL